jgi:CRISPR-associated protein Csb2
MLHIKFRFPGGRYHATPWGHHVNEGLVEWPPSPWRLARAFIATAFSKLDLPDPVPENHPLRRLTAALSGALPSYSLPPASGTHSRHYMPLAVLDKGKEKTTMVLDTCAAVGDGELVVAWPVDLDEECLALLQDILGRMSYLGRAESWVEAERLPSGQPFTPNCTPDDGSPVPRGQEQYSLLASVPSAEYAAWFEMQCVEVLQDLPAPTEGKIISAAQAKARDKALAPFPPDAFACLLCDSVWLQSHGWSQPPGSRRVLYRRPADALQVARPAVQARRSQCQPVEAVLLALASNHKRSVLPLFSRCLPQAEMLHRALVRLCGEPVFTGCDDAGQPLSGHRHMHVLPLSIDHPGHLDHILLWAPMGIPDAAQQTLGDLRHLWTKGQDVPLFVSEVGRGSLAGFANLAGDLITPSKVWESRTPFVPPRFVKKTGANTMEGQIQAELVSRNLPKAEEIAVWSRDEWEQHKFHQFVRTRRSQAKAPPRDFALGIRLTFATTISGPLCLGYASHFGLGLFAAVH